MKTTKSNLGLFINQKLKKMERNDGLKNNQERSDSPVFKKYSFEAKQKKVGLEYHYVVPWEIVD